MMINQIFDNFDNDNDDDDNERGVERGGCGGNSLISPTVLAAAAAAGEIELLHSMLMSFWNC